MFDKNYVLRGTIKRLSHEEQLKVYEIRKCERSMREIYLFSKLKQKGDNIWGLLIARYSSAYETRTIVPVVLPLINVRWNWRERGHMIVPNQDGG
jgi:hypothetical protein